MDVQIHQCHEPPCEPSSSCQRGRVETLAPSPLGDPGKGTFLHQETSALPGAYNGHCQAVEAEQPCIPYGLSRESPLAQVFATPAQEWEPGTRHSLWVTCTMGLRLP